MKDMLAWKIELIRGRINNLQLALSTYRVLRKIQLDNEENTSLKKIVEIKNKIDNTVQKISLSTRTLHSLETEFSAINDSTSRE